MGIPLFFLSFLTLFFSVTLSQESQHILLPLTHALSKTHQKFNSTPHLLRAISARSAARFHLHHHRKTHVPHNHHHQVSLPLSPGSDYTLSFNLNTKTPQTISLYMDTGSDLVWFPCAPFECILCEGKYNPSTTTPPANITTSATTKVPCSAAACAAVHASSSPSSSSNLCAIARCPLDAIELKECQKYACPPFYYAYGDGSLIAQLHQHPMTITTSSPALTVKNFTFGCAHTTLGEPIGVAGFGRGMISLPAQLASLSPHLGKRFSYCLVTHAFDSKKVRHPSPLILGRSAESKEKKLSEFVYTGMLDNPKHPYFYSVGLQGISVGKTMIPAPEIVRKVDGTGKGGMVVDSGTTFTMLPEEFYYKIVDEFDRRVSRVYDWAEEIEKKTGLGPCYYFDRNVASVIPSLTLHFMEEESSVVLPRKNYFYEFVDRDESKRKRNVGCLMLMNGGDEKELEGGPGATLGNYQQQGFEVVYDLESNRVGFAKRRCSLLWDSLN